MTKGNKNEITPQTVKGVVNLSEMWQRKVESILEHWRSFLSETKIQSYESCQPFIKAVVDYYKNASHQEGWLYAAITPPHIYLERNLEVLKDLEKEASNLGISIKENTSYCKYVEEYTAFEKFRINHWETNLKIKLDHMGVYPNASYVSRILGCKTSL